MTTALKPPDSSLYQPVTTTEDEPPAFFRGAPSDVPVVPQGEDEGPRETGYGLERWVPIVVFFSVLFSVAFVAMGVRSVFDRDLPSFSVQQWVTLVSVMFAVDGVLLLCMVALMARGCRKEIRRNKQWYAYDDRWYDTHTRLALVTAGVSAFTLFLVVSFYKAYGGESPYAWPSRYNIERWEKPMWWGLLMVNAAMFRLYGMLDKYWTVFRELAEPGLIMSKRS